jgi:FAD/FMN-containing dehydrogenase
MTSDNTPLHTSPAIHTPYPDVWLTSTDTQRLITPQTADELSGLLQRPDIPAAAISLSKLNQCINYWHTDHTIEVAAGMTIGQLQAITREHDQWWPTFAHPDATIATILAHDWPSLSAGLTPPLAKRYPRDLVLGLGVLTAHGQQTHCGGRVMKNVAGYDLAKLYCGSAHTLGIITQATLRLETTPQHFTGYWHPQPTLKTALATASQLLSSGQPLWACEVTQLEGDWGVFTIDEHNEQPLADWQALAASLTHHPTAPNLLAMVALPLTMVANLTNWLASNTPEAINIQLRPAGGLVLITHHDCHQQQSLAFLQQLGKVSRQYQGFIKHIAHPTLNRLDDPAVHKLHQTIKTQLDPECRLVHPAMDWCTQQPIL